MAAPFYPDATAASVLQPGPSLDLERFDSLSEMCASSDSPATIDALIEAFVEDGHARMLEMERSLEARDLVALADVAHELLGSSGTIGAVALSGAVGGVQRQAAVALGRPAVEPVDVEDLGRLLALMATEFHRAETALRAAASGGR